MVPVSDFLTRLNPNAIGCPEPLARQALIDSAIAFCEQSLAIQYDINPISVVEGQRDYTLVLPTDTELAQVVRVWHNGKMLAAAPVFMVSQVDDTKGVPVCFYMLDIAEAPGIRVYPTPDKSISSGLVVRAALRPTRSAENVHSALFTNWADVIVDGALARIYGTPDQDFTNEAKAIVLEQKVRAKTNTARVESLRGRAVSSLRVTMRAF